MKHLTTLSKQLALALALITTTACPEPAAVCDPNQDLDSDGLDDCQEYELGTAAHLADTDGDGISDYDEVYAYGFSPANNNYKFNPLIADTPKIRVDITSAPSVGLNLVHSNGTSTVVETERGNAQSVGRSQSGSETNSQAVEYSETLGASVTVSACGGSSKSEVTAADPPAPQNQEDRIRGMVGDAASHLFQINNEMTCHFFDDGDEEQIKAGLLEEVEQGIENGQTKKKQYGLQCIIEAQDCDGIKQCANMMD